MYVPFLIINRYLHPMDREREREPIGGIGTCGGTSVHCKLSLRGRIEREGETKRQRDRERESEGEGV